MQIMRKKKNVKYFVNNFSSHFLTIFIILFSFNFTSNASAEELTLKTAKQFFIDGMYNYADRSYSSSAEQFEALSKNHPYSNHTKHSLIMEAYTNYLDKEYEKISGIAEVFFRLFPDDDYEAYIMYILGMSYYVGVKQDERATDKIAESKKVFVNLLEKYPHSKFAENVQKKVDYLNKIEQLNDIKTAEYYYKTDNYISAMRRYAGMFEIYKKNFDPEIEERALCGIISLSMSMEMEYNASKYKKLLQQKYPNSKCLQN